MPQDTTSPVRLGTARELRELLRLPSVDAAWRIGREDLIPSATVRIGKLMRFRLDVVEAWIARGGSIESPDQAA